MSGAFVPRRHEEYASTISRITQTAIDEVEGLGVADIHKMVGDITLRVATSVFFGEELGGKSRVAIAGERSLRMVLSPGVVVLPYDVPGLPYNRFLSSVCEFNEEMRGIVSRRAEDPHGRDLLSGLVRASASDSQLSLENIVGHASVLFAAGHETSSNAISWVLFFLSQHQEWQERLRAELEAVLRGSPPAVSDVERMELLDMTILESLRLMPPAPWNSRTTTRESNIGDFLIPARTEVVGSIYHSHRDRDAWDRADEFLPERWGDPSVPRAAFRPFGGGQRVCIGASFAMLEMKLVLAMMLQRLRLELVEGARVDPLVNITMTFRRGLPMRVRSPSDSAARGRPKGGILRLTRLPA